MAEPLLLLKQQANDVATAVALALTQKYGSNVANEFQTYVKDEDFDEETLKCDIQETDIEDCSVVAGLTDIFENIFKTDESKQELWQIMKNALKNMTIAFGNNYNQIAEYIQKQYSSEFAKYFKSWFIQSKFTDEHLTDEFSADNGHKSSLFMGYLISNNLVVNESKIRSIWNDLKTILISLKMEPPSNSVTQRNSNSKSPPTNKIKMAFSFENIDVTTKVNNKKNMDMIAKRIKKQCPEIAPENNQIDIALYSVILFGNADCNNNSANSNNIPLLTFLVDSFNRYRIQRRKQYKLKYRDQSEFEAKFNDISGSDFITKKCKGFANLKCEHQMKIKFRDMCQSSINVFHRRMLPQARMNSMFDCRIDDSIIDFEYYIMQMSLFVDQHISSIDDAPLPCQFDLLIIPEKTNKNDFDDDDSDHDGNSELDMIGNIDKRLNGIKYCKNEDTSPQNVVRYLHNQMSLIMDDSKRNQRCIIVIDRRLKKNNKNGDTIYVYQSPIKEYREFEGNRNKLLNAALFRSSIKYLLPGSPTSDDQKRDDSSLKKNNNIGVLNGLNGYMFALSFHCMAKDEVRMYWFRNGFGTRFFMQDLKYYIPSFFVKKQGELLRNAFEKNGNPQFANLYKKCKSKLADPKFESFYRTLINTDHHSPH